MSGATLITCCYCGAQDIFKIHKGKRRQLACLSCGAPMRKMTPIKVAEPATQPKPAPQPAPTDDPFKAKYETYRAKYEKSKRHAAYHKKRKKKKGWMAGLWDELDDIFDIDDWFD